jgi:hypothetical protein
MKTKVLVVRRGLVFVILAAVLVCGFNSALGGEITLKERVTDEFLRLCDMAAEKLPMELVPSDRFYLDSYALRGMLVGYDMTERAKYLKSAKAWCDRVVATQKDMIPKDAYYMSYHRRPGEDEGDWYVADCGTVGMAVLATALRCDDSKDRKRYINSVEKFIKLVRREFTGPKGGVTPGYWRSDKEWWCSSATTAALCFQLYAVTGKKEYKQYAMEAIDFLLDWDYNEVVKEGEMVFEKQWPTVLFYSTEGWCYGLPYYKVAGERQKRVYERLSATMHFMVRNQSADGLWGVDPATWTGAKQCGMGLPVMIYLKKVKDKAVRRQMCMTDAGDIVTFETMIEDMVTKHMDGLVKLSQKERKYGPAMVYTVSTMAEFLNPGAIYEKTRKESHMLQLEECDLAKLRGKIDAGTQEKSK